MKNEAAWRPTKFVWADGRLQASNDVRHVAIASRLNVNLLATALFRLITQFATGRLLDLGCGSVPLYSAYKPRVSTITCVDWVASGHDIGHIDLPADLSQPLPLASNAFDTVLLTDVLEHIAIPERLLGEIRRILDSGGMLIGSVPFLYRLHEEPHDHYRYTIHALRRFAEIHGYAVEILEPYGTGTDVVADLVGKILVGAHWRVGPKLAAWSQSLGLRFGHSALGQRVNARHSAMPLGYVFAFRAA